MTISPSPVGSRDSIVRRRDVVEHWTPFRSEGFIEVYSEPNQGTTFKLYFPAIEDQPVSRDPESLATQATSGTETLLIVKDEDAVREIAVLGLQMHGYNVLTATDGNDALRVAENYQGDIDLLLTDLIMPGMSGRRLAEILGARLPNLRTLFMSGYTDDSVVRHGLVQESMAFLQKPFSTLGLAMKVRAVLDQRKEG